MKKTICACIFLALFLLGPPASAPALMAWGQAGTRTVASCEAGELLIEYFEMGKSEMLQGVFIPERVTDFSELLLKASSGYIVSGRYDEGLNLLALALVTGGKAPRFTLLSNLGVCLLGKGLKQAALGLFKNSYMLMKASREGAAFKPLPLYNIGYLYFKQRNFSGLSALSRFVLSFLPEDVNAKLGRALALFESDQKDKAREGFEEVMKLLSADRDDERFKLANEYWLKCRSRQRYLIK